MSEQTTETFVVLEPATRVPFYKNKKIVITAAAVTTVAVVLAFLKFSSTDEDQAESDNATVDAPIVTKK